jgi:transposase-like protein
MPWRERSVTQERLRFVARLLEGEGMSEVCRDFGISRKTGYKIFNRYRDQGLDALADHSRRPVRYANQLPDQVERLIVDFKRDKPQGRPQNPRTAAAQARRRRVLAGQEHRACGARPPRPGQARPIAAQPAQGTPLPSCNFKGAVGVGFF